MATIKKSASIIKKSGNIKKAQKGTTIIGPKSGIKIVADDPNPATKKSYESSTSPKYTYKMDIKDKSKDITHSIDTAGYSAGRKEFTGKTTRKQNGVKAFDDSYSTLNRATVDYALKNKFDKAPVKTQRVFKKGGVVKAKNGGKFPDLNKDGKITKADILKGRGVIAKKGASVKAKGGCLSCGGKVKK